MILKLYFGGHQLNQQNLPLYVKIADDLQFKINAGQWKAGEKLPSENEFEKSYNVSRITIRRALDELVQKRYLVRYRGKGTFVTKPPIGFNTKSNYTVIKSFTNEMLELGRKPATMWVHVSIKNASDLMARRLNVQKDSKLLKIERLRGADNEIITYSETFIPFIYDFSLNDDDYYVDLYDYLKKFGVHVDHQIEYVEAISVTEKLRSLLKMDRPEPILKRVREISDSSSKYTEYSINYYIGSRYRYYVTLQ